MVSTVTNEQDSFTGCCGMLTAGNLGQEYE
jgi:hypothetical protein